MINNGAQTILENMGKSGCYFLCLCNIAEEYLDKDIDVLAAAQESIARGYCGADFYVNYPGLILEMLTHKKWDVRHDRYPYKPESNEFVITRYEYKKTMNTLSHFERENFEPIKDCITSLYGKPASTRVCKVLN